MNSINSRIVADFVVNSFVCALNIALAGNLQSKDDKIVQISYSSESINTKGKYSRLRILRLCPEQIAGN